MPLSGRERITPHVDLNLLRTFLAVHRSGSFTGAAPLLGLSQPTTWPTRWRALSTRSPLVVEGVRLRVTQGLPEPLVDDLRAGHHDLLIATRRPRGRLAALPPTDEEYLLVAAPSRSNRPSTPFSSSSAPAPTPTRTSYGSMTASNTRPGPGSRPSRPPTRRVGRGRL